MQVHASLSLPRSFLLVLVVSFCCMSCSSSSSGLSPVQGKVLYKDEPIKGATVTFHPKGATDINTIRPIGVTKEDGTFAVTTGADEGAPPGDYVVTLICSEEVVPKGGKQAISTAPPERRDRFQGAYSNLASSTIKVTVKKGPNQLEPFLLK